MKTLSIVVGAAALTLAGCHGKENAPANGGNKARAAQAITGAGSTFIYPVLSAWAADYGKQTGAQVNYQSIGSGGGISQIKAGTVDFGASDKPLDPQELAASGLAQFPAVIGGVVPVVNISGVEPGKLRLTGPMLADIFAGRITQWSDPSIVKLNPGLKLPAAKIAVVHRSDASGTSFNWTHYLSQISPAWKSGPGEGTSVSWPTGVGGKGNEGVAAYIRQIPNAIGYVEYAYVLQNGMSWASVQNAAGNFVAPSSASFQAAAASADWAHAQDFHLVMTNAPGADAWPITATTFVLMHKQPKDEARSKAALDFFRWSLEKGQKQAQKLDYVPLPASLVKQVEAYMAAAIK
ncbi:MAG TPA: phosphate ABC transporter substrate-binding protein PstS [Sphingomonas sp.]|nr:phosphate ABC transporter substrate-binding protein PstS [Sphingomonas sp.]